MKAAGFLAAVFLCGFVVVIADARTDNDRLRAEELLNDCPEDFRDFLNVPRETHFLYRLSFRDPWPLYGQKIEATMKR